METNTLIAAPNQITIKSVGSAPSSLTVPSPILPALPPSPQLVLLNAASPGTPLSSALVAQVSSIAQSTPPKPATPAQPNTISSVSAVTSHIPATPVTDPTSIDNLADGWLSCASCAIKQSPIWHKLPNGNVLCNICVRINKEMEKAQGAFDLYKSQLIAAAQLSQQRQQQRQQPGIPVPVTTPSALSATLASTSAGSALKPILKSPFLPATRPPTQAATRVTPGIATTTQVGATHIPLVTNAGSYPSVAMASAKHQLAPKPILPIATRNNSVVHNNNTIALQALQPSKATALQMLLQQQLRQKQHPKLKPKPNQHEPKPGPVSQNVGSSASGVAQERKSIFSSTTKKKTKLGGKDYLEEYGRKVVEGIMQDVLAGKVKQQWIPSSEWHAKQEEMAAAASWRRKQKKRKRAAQNSKLGRLSKKQKILEEDDIKEKINKNEEEAASNLSMGILEKESKIEREESMTMAEAGKEPQKADQNGVESLDTPQTDIARSPHKQELQLPGESLSSTTATVKETKQTELKEKKKNGAIEAIIAEPEEDERESKELETVGDDRTKDEADSVLEKVVRPASPPREPAEVGENRGSTLPSSAMSKITDPKTGKRRGRPPKRARSLPTRNSESETVEKDPPSTLEQSMKRPRGRPRKIPIPALVPLSIKPATPLEVPGKRKRGRPKRVVSELYPDNEERSEEADCADMKDLTSEKEDGDTNEKARTEEEGLQPAIKRTNERLKKHRGTNRVPSRRKSEDVEKKREGEKQHTLEAQKEQQKETTVGNKVVKRRGRPKKMIERK